ncbi:MAG: hypothetical protein BroJett015_36690 [Chloroflexota bacterium]|nr:hypothetical protein [Ardenticatenaceae bacterium]GIK58006.1 MAG: hypothetical protein BroJett015_36690 [Chloroflexota bacterium]
MKQKPVYTLMLALLTLLPLMALACSSATSPTTGESASGNNSGSAGNSNNASPSNNAPVTTDTINAGAQASEAAATDSNQSNAPVSEQPVTEDPSQVVSTDITSSESNSNNRGIQALPVVTTDQVEVLSGWFVDEETGFLHIMGSIINKTDIPITGMISFIYYDTNGRAITVEALGESGESDKVSFSSPVAAGDTGYFHRARDLSKVNAEIARIEVDATSSYFVPETVSPAAEFLNLQWANNDYDGVTVSGEVKNSGDTVCKYPSLVIAYLQGGQVVEMDGQTLDVETLEPGQGTSFAFEKYLIPAAFDGVDVVIDCAPTSFPRP